MDNIIHILYGTTTGNSEVLAEETAAKLCNEGLLARVSAMEEFNPAELYQIETLLIIVSTDSGGVPPFMADEFYRYMDNKDEADLGHLSYSVLALGDSYYLDFCQTGKDFDHMFEELGAHCITERIDCDIDFWENYEVWMDSVLSKIENKEKVLNY